MDYLKEKFTRKMKTIRVGSARTARATSIYTRKQSRRKQTGSENEEERTHIKELGCISLQSDIALSSFPIEVPSDGNISTHFGSMKRSLKAARVIQNPSATDFHESAIVNSSCDDFISVSQLLSNDSNKRCSIETVRKDVDDTVIIQYDNHDVELSTSERKRRQISNLVSSTGDLNKKVRTESLSDVLQAVEDECNLSSSSTSLRKSSLKEKFKLPIRSGSFKINKQNFILKLTGRARGVKKRKGLNSINISDCATADCKNGEMEEMTDTDETTPKFINRSTLPTKIVRSPEAVELIDYVDDKKQNYSNTLPPKLRRQYAMKLHAAHSQSKLLSPPTPFKTFQHNEVNGTDSVHSVVRTKKISVELKQEIKESLLNWRNGSKLNCSDSTVTLPHNFKHQTSNKTPNKLLETVREKHKLRPSSWACDETGERYYSSEIQSNIDSDSDTLACCDRLSFTSGSSHSSLPYEEKTTPDHEKFVDGKQFREILKTYSLNRLTRSERRMSQPHFLKARNVRSTKKLDTIEASPIEKRVRSRKVRQRSLSAPSVGRPLSAGGSSSTDLKVNNVTKLAGDILTTGNRSSIQAFTSAICYRAIADPLFHHVTHKDDELAFHVGDVILVLDQSDKDWWWGRLLNTSNNINTNSVKYREGFFPSSFVRLRANQDSDLEQEVGSAENILPSGENENEVVPEQREDPDEKRWKTGRTNVVKEILSAERDYVKILSDIVKGYLTRSRDNTDMFTAEQIVLIFGNIENIHTVSQKFLEELESRAKTADQSIHLTLVGAAFLQHEDSFEVYSSYCNNHPQALSELSNLTKQVKYSQFFEGCRLLQTMIELPLDGFLLTPIQKICKYPLQLQELLKYTPTTHPDHESLQLAYTAMKNMAALINERKRKLESAQTIYSWQTEVHEWQGDEIIKCSSELIYSGELSKLSSGGRLVERYFFLFDHQLIQCRRDSIISKTLTYKNRFNLDQLNLTTNERVSGIGIKHGFQLTDSEGNTVIALAAKSSDDREKWLKCFKQEREIVECDRRSGFVLDEKFLSHIRSTKTDSKSKPNKNGITRNPNGGNLGRQTSGGSSSRPPSQTEEVDSNSNIRSNGSKPNKSKEGVRLRNKNKSNPSS